MVLLINCSVDSMGIESQALEKLDNTRCSMCIVNPIVCTALFIPFTNIVYWSGGRLLYNRAFYA